MNVTFGQSYYGYGYKSPNRADKAQQQDVLEKVNLKSHYVDEGSVTIDEDETPL